MRYSTEIMKLIHQRHINDLGRKIQITDLVEGVITLYHALRPNSGECVSIRGIVVGIDNQEREAFVLSVITWHHSEVTLELV